MQVGGARSGWCCWIRGQQGGGLGHPARLAGKASRKVSITAAAASPAGQAALACKMLASCAAVAC
jgi:hypothetical protein